MHCFLNQDDFQLTTTLEKCTKELEEAQKELEGKSLAIQELSQQRKILENKVINQIFVPKFKIRIFVSYSNF